MSEELREARVREVMDIFTEYAHRGISVWVSQDGTRVELLGSGAGDDAAVEAASEEFLWDQAMLRPYEAELVPLTETPEGRDLLLEAYRRWQEQDE